MVWLTLTLTAVIRAAGGSVPHGLEIVCAWVAAPVALAVAAHTLAGYWRGPTILSFPRSDSVVCAPDEAAYVRVASQVRGTMGGAGYLHPVRLLLPALSWAAAATAGVFLAATEIDPTAYAGVALVALGAAGASLFLPARPYYYREATDSTAILSPPSAARRLQRRAAVANAVAAGLRVDEPTPSPAPLPAGTLTPSGAGSRDAGR